MRKSHQSKGLVLVALEGMSQVKYSEPMIRLGSYYATSENRTGCPI